MGYEFPKDKQLTRSDLPRAAAAVAEKGKGKKVNMGDAKQLYEAGLAAMKALFGGQLVEHPVVAGLLFAEGEVHPAHFHLWYNLLYSYSLDFIANAGSPKPQGSAAAVGASTGNAPPPFPWLAPSHCRSFHSTLDTLPYQCRNVIFKKL